MEQPPISTNLPPVFQPETPQTLLQKSKQPLILGGPLMISVVALTVSFLEAKSP